MLFIILCYLPSYIIFIYHPMFNKLNFQNLSLESKFQSDRLTNKINLVLVNLNKNEQDFKNITDNLQKEIKKIHNDNDIFEYYISNLLSYVKYSVQFYFHATEHPIRKTTKRP